MQFNEKLKALRAEKCISQAELAKSIFVSRSAVAKWENGLGLPSEDSLKLLAEFFNTSVDELLSEPKHEEIIVKKNGVLSKQKIIIVILSVLLVVIATLTAVFVSLDKDSEADVKPYYPVVGRGLIFETEKTERDVDLKNYSDSELTSDKDFAPSRTFYITDENPTVVFPKPILEVGQPNSTYTYEDVDYSAVTFYTSDGMWIRYYEYEGAILAGLNDYYAKEYEGYANIKYGGERISVKIVKLPVPVESISIKLEDNSSEIGFGENKYLSLADIRPFDASYQNYSYVIEKIERADGTEYTGDISQYAEVKDTQSGYLLETSESLELNSKIYLYAITEKEKVKSNTLIVEVKRVAISDAICLANGVFSSAITAGESFDLSVSFLPQNATFNVLNEDYELTLLTTDIAQLKRNKNGWTLTASGDYSAAKKTIEIALTTPEGYTKTFEWFIAPVPVESMAIYNAETDTELAKVTYLYRGDSLRLKAVYSPKNATIGEITYHDFSNTTNFGAYIDISDDGVLAISDYAPLNMEIDIWVVSDRKSSKAYKIIVNKRQVEEVAISCGTNLAARGEALEFSVSYTPANADITSTEFKLVEEVEGVYISGNSIYVKPDVEVGTKFRVVAIYNGIESNVLEFTVV